MAKVLVVEDEPDIAELIARHLRHAGMEVVLSGTGRDALEKIRTEAPRLIVLDLVLPDLDGFEICRRIRRDPATRHIPFVIVSGRDTEVDRLLGFELGADDFVTKPFSPRELALRIRRSLDRCQPVAIDPETLVFGEMAIDVPGHRVLVRGRDLDLTATEFRLLTALARRRGRVLTREHLLADVWHPGEQDGVDARTVDTHIRRLRDKLEGAAHLVETVRGVGYRLDGNA